MKYFKDKFEKIFNEEIQYTVEIMGNYFMYNYSLKRNKYLICSLKIGENLLHIELLMIPEELRRSGIGTVIVNLIKKWAYQNNYEIIELYAIHNSQVFWKKQNFQFIKEGSNKMKYEITDFKK